MTSDPAAPPDRQPLHDDYDAIVDVENIFDKSYRGISWGIDGAGRGVTLRYRYEF